ncbi:RHS repeat domain-containing protein [Lysinibacillus sphaericus]|uniref:RHS repeat domain-containing protein n=1 Tax=Lysinibacillus sphaericus TaxID=1421 RepID=UPI002958641C|nr:RHS repeat-associated core domain-containing protein [Lysinibacillus sphaericus]
MSFVMKWAMCRKWQYDVTGRPTHHRISSQNRNTRRRAYNWDVNHRLRSMVNELTGVKVTYGYDEFSNLVWSNQGGQFDFLHRSVDDVGNLYETKEKTDRVYGAGSRLLETREAIFSYDEEGNLVQKVEKNGSTWKYEYNGNGMMAKVIRPDETEVTFKYDSLGRRIEKSSNEKIMKFVWDGNTILHEYLLKGNSDKSENLVESSSKNKSEVPDNLVTWVFNDGFVPSAKITNEGNYSIISDYLGTPVEAFDEEGNKVWSAELDIYGRVIEFTGEPGEQDFIPFRYQGQCHDIETGLYYNRFRYYDPERGNYTQIDPIGLAGGNPTLYGYVANPNISIDPFGLIVVFRNIRPDEDIAKGLSARIPGRNMTPHGHVAKGSSHKGSQFISTTTDIEVANSWRESGQRTVMFDTDDVIPDAVGDRKILDISTHEKARANGIGDVTANFSASSKEVLVVGHVPSNKLSYVNEKGVICKKRG